MGYYEIRCYFIPNTLKFIQKLRECMSKRITIMLDDDLDKKLRMLQAKMIQTTAGSVSFSKVINEELRKCIKK